VENENKQCDRMRWIDIGESFNEMGEQVSMPTNMLNIDEIEIMLLTKRR